MKDAAVSLRPLIAWHYTTGQHFKRICESGILMPAATAVTPPEKPILWFSLNQYWEPTANKGWRNPDGTILTLTMQQTLERAAGLVRFGCPLRLLRGGEALRKEARMKSAVWKMPFDEGERQGANPCDWRGTVKPLFIDNLAVDVMSKEWKWVPVRESIK